MIRYSVERKEAILRQMMAPENKPVSATMGSQQRWGQVLFLVNLVNRWVDSNSNRITVNLD